MTLLRSCWNIERFKRRGDDLIQDRGLRTEAHPTVVHPTATPSLAHGPDPDLDPTPVPSAAPAPDLALAPTPALLTPAAEGAAAVATALGLDRTATTALAPAPPLTVVVTVGQ